MIESDLNPRHALDINQRDHHVFPTDDRVAHEVSRDCVCGPFVEPVQTEFGLLVLVWWHQLIVGE